jgi:hypothetical protein
MKTIFESMIRIRSCFFSENFLLVCQKDDHLICIYRFEVNRNVRIFGPARLKDLVPRRLIALSHWILVIGWDSRAVVVWRLALDGAPKDEHVFDIAVTDPVLDVFDDCLLILDRPSGDSILIDFSEDQAVSIGRWINTVENVSGLSQSKLALARDTVWRVRPDYTQITGDTDNWLAGLMRREGGESRALALLIQKLRAVRDVDSMRGLIKVIGKSVTSPMAQIRFTRSIQFCGITNPHLILAGLWTYADIIGDKMDDRAKVPLWETMFHPSCRWTARGLMTWSGKKLNKNGIRTVMGLGENVDAALVQDVLDYVEVCLDMGNVDLARKLLVRSRMENGISQERYLDLKRKADEFIVSK